MKNALNITLLSLLFYLPLSLFGQSKSVDRLYQQYKDNDAFFHLDLAGNFLDFAKGWDIDIEEANLSAITESIDRVKLFKLPVNGDQARSDFKKLSQGLRRENYELMMEAEEKDSGVSIYSLGERSMKGLVLLIHSGPDSDYMVIELEGQFDQKALAKVGKGI
ncbi:protein of unknown function [Cyclobacterium lianum]|uniref:DUF4252 domain-containing protein n=1 Tax=Cyclobacterium lianum TaxID=388280 RepID=A0A1M7KGW0_9BACT|nr:DUF4252 domain-containing protein [Cyclobacterium lianum]SHM64571.1 protein of unknown function [Cyclobacterium lianum]